jgi:D-sedoheptulose 7-phosphate isomerase
MESWEQYLEMIAIGGRSLTVTDRAGRQLSADEGFAEWLALTHDTHQRGGTIYVIGNGGSAGIASHMAEDACKNGGLRAIAFNDPSYLTAIANDEGFDRVFSTPLERLSRPGDLLISVSSSGNSPNVVRALETAQRLEVRSVTLSGFDGGNRSRALGDLNFHLNQRRYGWVECGHQVVMHCWLDQYLNRYGTGAI